MSKSNRLGLVVMGSIGVLGFSGFAFSGESSAVKVGGFIDAQAHISNKSELTEGAVVNDGAVYLTHEMGDAEVKVDLPFRNNSDIVSTSTAGANFTIATTKAQAYVGYKHSSGLKMRLGQFDTIYGNELNDTVDTTYTRQGLVYTYQLPVVHAGLLTSYDLMEGLTFNALIANQKDQGVKRSKAIDYGAQAVFAKNDLRFSAGFLQNRLLGVNYPLFEVMAGATFGKLSFDTQFDIKKPAAAATQKGWGVMGTVSYMVMDDLTASFRAEHLHKVVVDATTSTYNTRHNQFTVGPQYNLTKNLKIKADYTYLVVTPDAGAAKVKTSTGVIAAVYKL